jgi:hypothetical protein
MSSVLNIEIFCPACQEDVLMTSKELNLTKKIQLRFKDEWATEEICLKCAKSHSCDEGAYWDEEDEKELSKKNEEYMSKGYKFKGGMWTKPDGGMFLDEELVRKMKSK